MTAHSLSSNNAPKAERPRPRKGVSSLSLSVLYSLNVTEKMLPPETTQLPILFRDCIMPMCPPVVVAVSQHSIENGTAVAGSSWLKVLCRPRNDI